MAIFRGTGGQGDSTTDTTVTTVTQKAAEAASSATSAATSATAASNSATSAETSATNAATSESNAATSATASATSATAAETAKTAAQAAQTAAETAETNAETAETNAETAQAAAEAAQAAAETAQTNAETAETNAETAETNAETAYANTLAIFGDAQDVQDAVDDAEKLAVNPEDSQYTLSDAVTTGYSALHYAAKAEDSAALSQAGKNDAQTASDAATVSSTLAATYASNASDSADDAAVSASQALSYKNAAENRYDLFNDRFLGQITGDPDTDNNGDPLVTGALYFNTIENEIRVYTGSAWEPIQELSGDQTVNSLTSNNDVVVKGNLEVQGTTITVDSATAQTIDLGDNDKIRLGDEDDLQIYHDGTHSYVTDNGTGNLRLKGYNVQIVSSGNETMGLFKPNEGASLWYDNSKKIETTSTGVDVTGNITVSGTVDGRDIAADGTTLDAVASTYVDVSGDTLTGDLAFGDNVKAKFGASDDLQIYHDGTHSWVNDAGTGDLILRGNNVRLMSAALEYYLYAAADGAVSLYHNNSAKLATTSSGVDITGTVVADKFEATSTSFLESTNLQLSAGFPRLILLENDTTNLNSRISHQNGALRIETLNDAGTTGTKRLDIDHSTGDISFYEDTGTTAKLTWDASAEELQFKDNVKAEFGDGGDLVIYHDGSNSRIQDLGTGNLNVQGNNLVLSNTSGNPYLQGVSGGTTALYYAGSSKLTTTSTGIDVTGTVTADDEIIVDGASGAQVTIRDTGRNGLQLSQNSTGGGFIDLVDATENLHIRTQSTNNIRIQSSGDISFYDDSGTSQDFYWDASLSRLGLGTANPEAPLEVAYTTSAPSLEESDAGFLLSANNTLRTLFGADPSSPYAHWIQVTNSSGSAAFPLALNPQGGNVGIGTTSPSYNVEIRDSSNPTVAIIKTGVGGLYLDTNSSASDATMTITASSGLSGQADLAFKTGGNTPSEAMRIDSSGNVGIGTTSPAYQLHVGGTTDNTVAQFKSIDDTSQILISDDDTNGYLGVRGNFIYISPTSGTGADGLVVRTDTGNVGIGTTSPSRDLVVKTGGSGFISVVSSPAQDVGLLLGDTDSDSVCQLKYSNSSNALLIHTNGSEAMRIDSSGRLGIGTTTPQAPLDIKGTQNSVVAYIGGDSDNAPNRKLSITGSNNDLTYTLDSTGAGYGTFGQLAFATNNSEAARIDSSGNLLVGTTNSSPISSNVEGISLRESGTIQASRDGSSSLVLNRKTSDGTIVDFRKDGTTVGSIGVDNSDNIFLSGNSSHSGLMAGSNGIIPYANGSFTDATEDLGQSTIRWRNLYLSGGVYLGGTGSANLLDDYEEGTWTPSFNGYSTGFTGRYTKIGNIIHCRIERTNSIPSSSITGSVTITGLPFVAQRSYTPLLGHIRAASSTRPFGIIRNNSIGLVTDSVFGSNSYYNETHANWDGSNLTQNGVTGVYIAWEFTYRQG